MSFFYQKLTLSKLNRVATQPGKPGEPGKVREFDISPKNQGKVREFCRFYSKTWKSQGI